MMKSKRIEHIDIAKGISIALVAVCHSKLQNYFTETIESMALFRVLLFFLLSGIFFSWMSQPKDFVLKKADALLKPYFVVLFSSLIFIYFLSNDALAWYFKGILYGNGDTLMWEPMWFLPHLFVVYLFSYILFRFTFLSKR